MAHRARRDSAVPAVPAGQRRRRARACSNARGDEAWVIAGGMDSFDWLKDRTKRTSVVVELSQVAELHGIRESGGGLEIGATTTLDRGGRAPGRSRALPPARGSGRARRLAADPQPGHARRQRVAGRAVLVLPARLALLPGRRQHLLRRHADRREPRARHPAGRSLRGGQPVGYCAGAHRARCADGHPPPRAASASSMRPTTSWGRTPTSRG